MKLEVELEEKNNEKTEVGDWIKFDGGVIGLVIKNNELVLLQYSDGSDLMTLSVCGCGFEDEFKKRNYKILAKSEDVIVRRR